MKKPYPGALLLPRSRERKVLIATYIPRKGPQRHVLPGEPTRDGESEQETIWRAVMDKFHDAQQSDFVFAWDSPIHVTTQCAYYVGTLARPLHIANMTKKGGGCRRLCKWMSWEQALSLPLNKFHRKALQQLCELVE